MFRRHYTVPVRILRVRGLQRILACLQCTASTAGNEHIALPDRNSGQGSVLYCVMLLCGVCQLALAAYAGLAFRKALLYHP